MAVFERKYSLLLTITSLSPVIAAVASYGINVLAASGLGSAVDYSQYLKLQAWSIYFGSISALCLVDLKLSPNGRQYKVFSLLGLAILSAFLFLSGMVLFGIILGSIFFLTIAIVSFFYAVFRGLLIVGLMIRIPKIPITLRLSRSLLLFGLGGAALIGFAFKSTPTHFMAIQGVAAAIPFLVYLPRISRVCFSELSSTVRIILKRDRVRLIRRNLTYWVSMVHTPLFYTAIAGVSSYGSLKKFIYLIGLLLPVAFLFNEIVFERLRLRFGLMDFYDLKENFNKVKKYVKKVVTFYWLIYLVCAIVAILAIFGFIGFAAGIIIALSVQILFVCASSLPGLVISKAGMEVVNLSINLAVSPLLIVAVMIHEAAPVAAILASFAISSKFIACQTGAYLKISRGG